MQGTREQVLESELTRVLGVWVRAKLVLFGLETQLVAPGFQCAVQGVVLLLRSR
jgi:hypothetical protein